MKHGLICGRFQPLHQGHISLIKMAMSECDVLAVAVGSSQYQNHYCEKNPYSYSIRASMLERCFKEDISSGRLLYFPVNDINNPPKWVEHVVSCCPASVSNKLNTYFAGSSSDAQLFIDKGFFTIILDRSTSSYKSGTELRTLIRENNLSWRNYVPEEIWSLL